MSVLYDNHQRDNFYFLFTSKKIVIMFWKGHRHQKVLKLDIHAPFYYVVSLDGPVQIRFIFKLRGGDTSGIDLSVWERGTAFLCVVGALSRNIRCCRKVCGYSLLICCKSILLLEITQDHTAKEMPWNCTTAY